MPILSLKKSVEVLQNSGIIAFPTETVYGLGADATNKTSVLKVFEAKNRPADNPLICHFYSIDQINEYVQEIPDQVKILFEFFAPGPVSLLLNLPGNSSLLAATCGKNQVMCRIPNHNLALKLIQEVGKPLVGPSANISGRPSGTNAKMVLDQFGNTIDGVLDGGNCEVGLESTIIDALESGIIKILRPGAIGETEILECFQKHNLTVQVEYKAQNGIVIPGNKYPHYSPKTPIYKIQNLDKINNLDNCVILAVSEKIQSLKNVQFINLGSLNNLEEISHNLYQNLQSVDSKNLDKAYFLIENWGNSSLALALTNRISKVGQNLI